MFPQHHLFGRLCNIYFSSLQARIHLCTNRLPHEDKSPLNISHTMGYIAFLTTKFRHRHRVVAIERTSYLLFYYLLWPRLQYELLTTYVCYHVYMNRLVLRAAQHP